MADKKYHHDIKLVEIKNIKPNEYNPNVLETPLMEQLTSRIKEEGFLQPILLREIKDKGKYEIIDGEHRFLAGQKVGYDKLPAIIVDKELPEAMISTINMNKLRGQFDTLKLAEVIHELNKTYSIEELEEKLGYTPEQLKGMENLLSYDFDSLSDEGVEGLEEPELEEIEFKLMLTKKQAEVIEDAIDLTGRKDRAEGLVTICMEYLKNNAK